ncbi:MAG: hypothetical protein ABW157_00200 [Candidatus Thiodiazotropha sp. LLP2]
MNNNTFKAGGFRNMREYRRTQYPSIQRAVPMVKTATVSNESKFRPGEWSISGCRSIVLRVNPTN